MGNCTACGATPQTQVYKYNNDKRVILKKDVDTISKWTKGALARRRFRKIVLTNQIAGLKYPVYQDNQLVASEERLMSEKDLFIQLDYERGGKGLVWNNFYVEIAENKRYQGQWTKDKYKPVWEGLGTIRFADGSVYQGQTKNALFHGVGRLTHANGDIYQGHWKEGKACGEGTFVDAQGTMYKGPWVNDQYHGKGVETWNNNSIKYEGEFVNGKKTGQGLFEFNGNYYAGQFKDGTMDGQGTYFFNDTGKTYKGEFRQNSITGTGVMTWQDGSQYEGQFDNGQMNGKGIKTWPNGNTYDGLWKNNLQHGQGEHYSVKNDKATPEEWRDGKKWTWAKKTNQVTIAQRIGGGLSQEQKQEIGWAK